MSEREINLHQKLFLTMVGGNVRNAATIVALHME
jgi:hypothetical protein